MKLLKFENIEAFLEMTLPILTKFEVENNLILGIALALKNDPSIFPEKYLRAIANNGRIETIAVCTPPYKLLLYSKLDDASDQFELIANDVKKSITIPGVLAANKISLQFAKIWQEQENIIFQSGMSERIYKLEEVRWPSINNGKMKLASMKEFEFICECMKQFHNEAVPHNPVVDFEKTAENKIKNRSLFFWEVNDLPVAVASKARSTVNGICINLVYTPPVYRKKGYASSLVATLSQYLLDSGYKFVMLFTDLSNPTSNNIYQKVGFEPVCDFQEYYFEKNV